MNWDELKKNKVTLIIVAIVCLNVFVLFGGQILIDKIADRVIQKLQKEYSPAKPPYGPGLNPDMISTNIIGN